MRHWPWDRYKGSGYSIMDWDETAGEWVTSVYAYGSSDDDDKGHQIAVDSYGSVFLAENDNNVIYQIAPNDSAPNPPGTMTVSTDDGTVAVNGVIPYSSGIRTLCLSVAGDNGSLDVTLANMISVGAGTGDLGVAEDCPWDATEGKYCLTKSGRG
ncbi:hypothetical protein KIPB_010575 [Kipferlia bialata]|uniref:Uncharacterized protein n=1 Tax=Kipferlia bialata TaxID=797122 RepID=A0A9K3GMF7_9EUKA|nr:hypothetical protein KIPB_010575 [Kipferlia bialata]|eukprot:g10575.t1